MSREQPNPEHEHERVSPLRRYFDTVSIYELNDPARASEIHDRACRDLLNLLEGFSLPQDRIDLLAAQVMPADFDEREFTFEEWQLQMRLVPMRLLYRAVPDEGSLTEEYLAEVVTLTMNHYVSHASHCDDTEYSSTGCQVTAVCPARLTRAAGMRTAALLVQSLDAMEMNAAEGYRSYQALYQKIQTMGAVLVLTKVLEPEVYSGFTEATEQFIESMYESWSSPSTIEDVSTDEDPEA